MSSEDCQRALSHQVQQRADRSLQLFSSHRQEAFSPLVGELLPRGGGSSGTMGTEMSQLLCAALSVSQCAPALLGAAHRGSQQLRFFYFVHTQMLKINTSQFYVLCTTVSFVFCFLRGRYGHRHQWERRWTDHCRAVFVTAEIDWLLFHI